MNDRRFDTLVGSLDTNSGRGALRAIGALGVAGLVDRLGVTTAEAGKKCRRRACPPRDTCPGRKCCQCTDPADESILLGCHLVPATATHSDCVALCTPKNGDLWEVGAGNTVVCVESTTCSVASCPI